MFKDKHVIVAMLVAPVLAVLAWWAVGEFTGEKPQLAKPGETYPLVEKSNCRYDSGFCDLENEDFKLILSLEEGAGPALRLNASHALDSVLLSVAAADGGDPPRAMREYSVDGLVWRLPLAQMPGQEDRIRLVASAGGVQYFAEAGTTWLGQYRGD